MWEISGLNVSRRPMALYETLHAKDEINRDGTTMFYFQKVLVFVRALCFKTVNVRRKTIHSTVKQISSLQSLSLQSMLLQLQFPHKTVMERTVSK